MAMKQLLLFPDPRPLVERIGPDFFRNAPQSPGVYLFRDATGTVLYVGKAKNLRKRLATYRVANPERLQRRRLRLLWATRRIELQECANEDSAIAREWHLLRTLQPRFNRAGTWVRPDRRLTWRLTQSELILSSVRLALPPALVAVQANPEPERSAPEASKQPGILSGQIPIQSPPG